MTFGTKLVWLEDSEYRHRLYAEAHPERYNEAADYFERNAYGLVVSWDESSKKFIPVICGHGGSMWLCRECAEKAVRR